MRRGASSSRRRRGGGRRDQTRRWASTGTVKDRGGERRLIGKQPQRRLDEGKEGGRVAQQVVGLAGGHRAAHPGERSGALVRTGGEVGGPLPQLGRDGGQQHPRAGGPAGAGGSRAGPGRGGRRPCSPRGPGGSWPKLRGGGPAP